MATLSSQGHLSSLNINTETTSIANNNSVKNKAKKNKKRKAKSSKSANQTASQTAIPISNDSTTDVNTTAEAEKMRAFFRGIKRDSVLVSATADYSAHQPSYGFLTRHRLNAVLPVIPSRPPLLTDAIYSEKARPLQPPHSVEITLDLLRAKDTIIVESPTSAFSDHDSSNLKITKFTNCDILRNGKIIKDETLWLRGGKIVDPASLFYDFFDGPDEVVNLGEKKSLIVPGFLDLQINGYFGCDFAETENIDKNIDKVAKGLIKYGVTSFCPTLVSSHPETYHKVLPIISHKRGKFSGRAEVLGAHIEGPFLAEARKGAHDANALRSAPNGYADLLECYGPTFEEKGAITILTVAPELEGLHACIHDLQKRSDIIVSLGHTEASYKEAEAAVAAGATMVTHLFNAMEAFHHRDPGPVGLIGCSLQNSAVEKPYYGIIADGVHADPSSVRIAYVAHPEGCILVTDAIAAAGVEGDNFMLGTMRIRRKSNVEVVIEGTNTLAGSVATMPTCIRNLVQFTGCTLAQAINAATMHPAKSIGISDRKGTLMPGTDADFVILDGFDATDSSVFSIAQVYGFKEIPEKNDFKQHKLLARIDDSSAAFTVYAATVINNVVKENSNNDHQTITAAAAAINNSAAINDSTPSPETLERLSSMFTINSDKLNQIVRHFVSEMKKGLDSDKSGLLMIPSHVVNLPNGKEHGSFLALDLGGTNFRVCEVFLDGHSGARVRQSKHTVTDEQKALPGEQLFDFFAQCVKHFLIEGLANPSTEPLAEIAKRHWKLGFTFSFATNQVAIAEGYLILWNKGFSNPGVIGANVVQLLEAALKRAGLASIKVTALVNDTTGTLVSHAYVQPSTRVGVILGTGTNCAYVEKIENITKYKNTDPNVKEMLVNTEWGAFDDEQVVVPRNKYDVKVDRSMNGMGKYTFEKLISGMYLGEIVRFVLVDLVKTGEIFSAGASPELKMPHSFETAFMSRIERDHTLDLSDTRTVLEDMLKIPRTTLADRRLVKSLCELVGKRSARLSAAGIAAVITKMNKLDGCTVGIDGSLFELYPHYSNRMRDALREILGLSAEYIVLEQARDGSGQGAALIAALAEK
ncbi:hexokinase A [Physocladia obscura]|uniref:N-acetylglucosamine-6-phosphate deacetylase n=1 Tax=Physocladia obscura TaxID=109957 RepID=A0AAD5XD94_9FUNG|nr:hexokinase A [Physocladia obscura]